MKILLIEPDVVLGAVYKRALDDYGVCQWVRSAEAAVKSADDDEPDMVILEPRLPRHNGIEFLYEFRSYSEWQSVPIVVLSSGGVLETVRAAKEVDFAACLDKKSVTLEDLCHIVSTFVKRKKS